MPNSTSNINGNLGNSCPDKTKKKKKLSYIIIYNSNLNRDNHVLAGKKEKKKFPEL
jgi:hypothetical protein